MAGRGQRFSKNGFDIPKPLIMINGKTMIENAVETLGLKGNFIFIVYRYEDTSLNKKIHQILNSICENPTIVEIDYITEGPASSALLAEKYLNLEEELIIANCDQVMSWDSDRFLKYAKISKMDGIVVTYDSDISKNSYIRLDENGFGIELAEKKVISKLSLNGIHYWRKSRYFVDSTKKMIEKNLRVNNEFYISMTYNEMIEDGYKIGNYHIDTSEHHAVGTPEDLEKYLKNGYI